MYSVSYEVFIESSPGRVFDFLTIQHLLSKWFAPQVIASPKEGTVAAFAFDFDLNFKMELDKLDKSGLVRWRCVDGYKEWLGSVVEFSFNEKEGGTLLKFKHSGLKNDDKKEKTLSDWIKFLEKLKIQCTTL